MAKQRRGVKFNHRNGSTTSLDGRRSSFSDISEAASEPGSPTKMKRENSSAAEVRFGDIELSLESGPFANILRPGSKSTLRVREEEADLHDPDAVDFCYDRWIFHCHVHGTHLHHHPRHSRPDHIVQGGDCDSQCTQSCPEITLYQVPELVLFSNNHVLSLRRECDLLFQAHCLD